MLSEAKGWLIATLRRLGQRKPLGQQNQLGLGQKPILQTKRAIREKFVGRVVQGFLVFKKVIQGAFL